MIEFTIVNYVQRQAVSDHSPPKKRHESFANRAQKVLQRFRAKDHKTLEEEDLLDHVIFNGALYDPLPGKTVGSVQDSRLFKFSPSPNNNRKALKTNGEVEMKSDSINELWKEKMFDKAERLALKYPYSYILCKVSLK
ncbi:hypothetical protein OESDEN_21152 [Oesophagostomum dentatum]|uniref:Uncharacterized protein n=1 Tax=Oesophagostomum dentatum TaxID=61180 RepID=A0A0B1S1K0_OESDE|nr:hypothetical protein OESDEN_21152 [Oesophagostomum dentatum]